MNHSAPSACCHAICSRYVAKQPTCGKSLAGWPILTTLSLLLAATSRSTMLSTAMLEAAQASTRQPRATWQGDERT